MWAAKPFSTMVVTELTQASYWGGRFDVVAVTPNRGHVKIIEVKTSRSDFLHGLNKEDAQGRTQFQHYMEYCQQFFVAVPAGLVEKDELPKDVGLIEVYESGTTRNTKRAAIRSPQDFSHKYRILCNRVIQKLIVEGHRWSQETVWKQQNEAHNRRWRFRDWLDAQEGRRPAERIYVPSLTRIARKVGTQ